MIIIFLTVKQKSHKISFISHSVNTSSKKRFYIVFLNIKKKDPESHFPTSNLKKNLHY